MIYISWMSVTNRYMQIWQNCQFASAPNTLGMRRNSGIIELKHWTEVPQTASLNFQNGKPPSKDTVAYHLESSWVKHPWDLLGVTSLTTMWGIYLIQIFIKKPRVTFRTEWHHSLNSRQEGKERRNIIFHGQAWGRQNKTNRQQHVSIYQHIH